MKKKTRSGFAATDLVPCSRALRAATEGGFLRLNEEVLQILAAVRFSGRKLALTASSFAFCLCIYLFSFFP
jgi:hypothetical protein